MAHSVTGPPWLAHIGGELGPGQLIVLAVIAIVANTLLLAPRVFGLFLKGPLIRALEEVAGPDARIGPVTLPLRGGSLSVEGVEIPGLPEITRVEAEVDLLGLRRDPVTIPRIVLTRPPVRDGSPGPRAGEPRPVEAPRQGEPTARERPSSGLPGGDGASKHRRFQVGTIVLRTADPDDTESDGPERSIGRPEATMGGPGVPTELVGLLRHLVREVERGVRDSPSSR